MNRAPSHPLETEYINAYIWAVLLAMPTNHDFRDLMRIRLNEDETGSIIMNLSVRSAETDVAIASLVALCHITINFSLGLETNFFILSQFLSFLENTSKNVLLGSPWTKSIRSKHTYAYNLAPPLGGYRRGLAKRPADLITVSPLREKKKRNRGGGNSEFGQARFWIGRSSHEGPARCALAVLVSLIAQ